MKCETALTYYKKAAATGNISYIVSDLIRKNTWREKKTCIKLSESHKEKLPKLYLVSCNCGMLQ